ncbi:MAG TPA: VIT domain-containing protein [Levilinea sp.]|nr:VIT domain-containing protein [Levilinea sp.]
MRICQSMLLLAVLLFSASVQPVQADGIIIPELPPPCRGDDCPPFPHPRPISQLAIRYHHVDVKIGDQIAVTRLEQVFYNPNDWDVEGVYLFPLPLDATVTEYVLWIDGEPVQGEVLDAEQARRTYEEIVRNLRDPALLEYAGRGALQASIFPIPPRGERKIELEYTQVLTASHGLVNYTYPLNTEKFSVLPLESVVVRVEVHSSQPLRAAYSPSHPVSIEREGENVLIATYEGSDLLPDADFSLMYSIGESEAFHLFSYRDPSDPAGAEGFFMALLAPRPGEPVETVNKDLLLVLDRSGSMEGEKFLQAQAALRFILNHLNPGDRFYLMAFSSGTTSYASGLRSATDAEAAEAWVNRLNAEGSTDINRALLEAAAVTDKERPTYLIFLTDGLPTEGETDSERILENFKAAAPDNLRLFAFGVGWDVDTFLLDSLSQNHQGLSFYVQPGENLDERLSEFYARISTPVLTNLTLDFGTIDVYDLYPQPLPDLFVGAQVVVVGRYRNGGEVDIVLAGEVNGERQSFRFTDQSFANDSRGAQHQTTFLPRLWATRKIGYLLNRIRLNGPDEETIGQIVRLSIRYGIVTPYTSYLVTEPMPLGVENQERLAVQTFQELQAAPAAPVFGQDAVEKAVRQGALSQAEQAPVIVRKDNQRQGVRTIGARTFIFNQDIWVDTAYDPESMAAQKVAFLSPEYFSLAYARPDIAAALALAERVIVVVDGAAYQIVAESEPTGAVELPGSQPPVQPPASVEKLPEAQPAGPQQTGAPLTCLGLPLVLILLAIRRH